MPHVEFRPEGKAADVEEKTKILLASRKAGVLLRFACASCRCGTCAVRVTEGADKLSPIAGEEGKLLKKLQLPIDGTIRLSCQARVLGNCVIDTDFQNEYDSDMGLQYEDDED